MAHGLATLAYRLHRADRRGIADADQGGRRVGGAQQLVGQYGAAGYSSRAPGRQPVGGQAKGFRGLQPARIAVIADFVAWVPADESDPAMPRRRQILYCEADAVSAVDVNPGVGLGGLAPGPSEGHEGD